jgi:hypothetical protein
VNAAIGTAIVHISWKEKLRLREVKSLPGKGPSRQLSGKTQVPGLCATQPLWLLLLEVAVYSVSAQVELGTLLLWPMAHGEHLIMSRNGKELNPTVPGRRLLESGGVKGGSRAWPEENQI